MSMPEYSQTPYSRWQEYLANLGLGQKFNLVVISNILSLLIIGAIAFQGLVTLRVQITNLQRRMLVVEKLQEAQTEMQNAQAFTERLKQSDITDVDPNVLAQIITGSQGNVEKIIGQYEGEWVSLKDPYFAKILSQTSNQATQNDEISTLQALRVSYNDYAAKASVYRNALLAGNATKKMETEARDASKNVFDDLEKLQTINQRFNDISMSSTTGSFTGALSATVIFLILSVPLTVWLTTSISQSFSSRLNELLNTAHSLEDGNLKSTLMIDVPGLDEIAFISSSIKRGTDNIAAMFRQTETHMAEQTVAMEETIRRNEQRARQFDAIFQTSRAIALIQDLNALLPRVAEVISEQFGYYHVGIFLLDSSREYAVLSAANSEGGQRMLLREHKLRVGQVGIVGYVTGTGSPRIALDTGADAVYFDNPDLPNTRSEMALPLRVGGQVIGALDVQSEVPNAFVQEDVEVLSTLTDQISIAIQNSRSFAEAQKLLAEAQNAVTGYVQDAWKVIQTGEKRHGYKISGADVVKLGEPMEQAYVRDAVKKNDTIIEAREAEDINVAVPVRMRGKVIGALSLKIPANQGWQQDQVEIAESIASRLSLAMETAILLQTSQRRANIERITSDITSKIGASTRFDSIVKTAAQELSKTLGSAEVLIQIEPAAIDMIKES